ncbi:hypothetical protein KCU92_g6345, partial [Aureobasidium melanogenum]
MTELSSTPPFMLSILLDDKIVFKLDILFLFSVILAVTYFAGLFFWLRRIDECLFFKAIAHGFSTVNSYLGLAHDEDHDSSQDDSPISGHDNQVISSEDDDSKNKPHDNSSETTKNHCSICGQGLPAAQHASSSDIDSNSTMTVNKDTVPGNKLPSHAERVLLSLGDHLELSLANLTQTEADDMLFELRTLRSTVGSRVPLFVPQINPPVDAFSPDAWYGEACLIDALIWLLKKRFPDRGESQVEFPGLGQNKENKEKESTEQKRDEQEHGERALQQEKQEQEKQEQEKHEEENRSTSSFGQPDSHVDPVASVEPDMPSSPSSTSSYSPPALNARGVTFHVEYSVVDRLGDLSEPEVDALVVKLKSHRRKLVNKRANAIVRSFWNGKEYVLEVKALWDARIGLVDGIMAVMRQYNLSSEDPVHEDDDGIPDSPSTSEMRFYSIFRLDNPRERRNSA